MIWRPPKSSGEFTIPTESTYVSLIYQTNGDRLLHQTSSGRLRGWVAELSSAIPAGIDTGYSLILLWAKLCWQAFCPLSIEIVVFPEEMPYNLGCAGGF